MTVDNKQIKTFLNEIKFKIEFLKNMYDWEYDFLFSSAESYGVNPIELARFILDYREKSVRKKRIIRQVVDGTGKVYSSLSAFAKEKGIDINKATYWVRRYPDRVKYLEVA